MGFDLNFGGSCFGGNVFSFWISWCWTAGICDPGELVDLSFGRTIHDIDHHSGLLTWLYFRSSCLRDILHGVAVWVRAESIFISSKN